MTYSTGGSGYPPAQQHGPYAQTTQFSKPDGGPSKWPLYALAAVVFFGLAAFGVSFGTIWGANNSGSLNGSMSIAPAADGIDLIVVAALLAALLAGVALVPKQSTHTGVIVVLSVVAFLLSIWQIGHKPDTLSAGWGLITIIILTALEALAAVGALLLEAEVITPPAPRPKYDQYQQYGGYYGQPGPQQHTPQSPQQNLGQRPGGYPQYGGYPGGPSTGGFPAGGQQSGTPTPPTGFPSYGQPPGQGSSSAPGQQQQQQGAIHEQQTQQVSTQQQMPSQQQSGSSSPSGPPVS